MHRYRRTNDHHMLVSSSLILLSVFCIYANTFQAGWHMDDTPNIVNNRPLHIDNLMPHTLWDTFFARPGHFGELYRPIPCLTFALNWFVGQDDTTGYHLVNTGIHAITACLIYCFAVQLFRVPSLSRLSQTGNAHFIALLSALLWAVHPLQTQAVTYIVQRMAQMAALFYVSAMLFYLRGRLAGSIREKWFNFTACGMCGALGVLSKENAAMLPLALLLMEICFFNHGRLQMKARHLIAAGAVVCLLVYTLGVYLFMNGDLLFFLKAYPTRPYTPYQRLLTESRILWFYLSQVILPLPGRLSIEHDVIVSTSLWSPWNTLPAVLGIGGLAAAGVAAVKRHPVAAFSVLFFLLNHIIESSIIGLELIFEHRNYLPTAFIFLPIAMAIKNRSAWIRNRHVRYTTAVVLVCLLGIGTYVRNQAWADGQTLWLDALTKAPNSARALNTLGIRLAWAPGATAMQMDKAIDLFQRSLSAHKARTLMDADIYGNIGNVYSKKGEYAKSIVYLKKAIAVDPGNFKLQLDMATSLIRVGRYAEALQITQQLIDKDPRHWRALNTAGFILLWMDMPAQALTPLRKALQLDPQNVKVFINIGAAMKALGHHAQADWFFLRAIQRAPDYLWAYLFLVDNQVQADRHQVAEYYLSAVIRKFSIGDIEQALNTPRELLPPFSRAWLQQALKDRGNQMGDTDSGGNDRSDAIGSGALRKSVRGAADA